MANLQESLENKESISVSKNPVYKSYHNLFVYSDRLQDRIEQKEIDMQDYLCELMNVYQSYHDFILEQQYAVRGSILRCQYGTKLTRLDTISDHGVYMQGIPVMTCGDCRSWNVHNFGSCLCPESLYENRLPMPAYRSSRGEVAQKAPYNKFPHTCVPVIDVFSSGWKQKESDLIIDVGENTENALTVEAVLACRYGGYIQIIGEPLMTESKPEDNEIKFLSTKYWEWLFYAEGEKLFPYLCTADSNEAKEAKTVTIGRGITFNKDPKSWVSFKSVLGWKDEDFITIIDTLFSKPNKSSRESWAKENYPITTDQSKKLFEAEAIRKYIPKVNEAIKKYREENPDNIVIYSQCQLEAIFDFAYNNGQSGVIAYRDNQAYIIYYYLRNLQDEGVAAVKEYNESKNAKRRINQMYLFFKKQYDYTDLYKDRMRELGFDEAYISTKEE